MYNYLIVIQVSQTCSLISYKCIWCHFATIVLYTIMDYKTAFFMEALRSNNLTQNQVAV